MTPTRRNRLATLTFLAVIALCALLAVFFSPPGAQRQAPRVTVELTANTWLPNRQVEPTIAANSDGVMLVAWASRRQEDLAFGVYAQLLDPLGRPIGTEIHVNQQIDGAQASPAVAFDPASGRAMVAWESIPTDGSGAVIVGRCFGISAQGADPLTDEFPINSATGAEQTRPTIAINSAGSALVAWTSTGVDGTTVKARLFGADGAPSTDEFELGAPGASAPIAAATNDGFVIVGSARDSDGRPAPLWMQRVDRNGDAGSVIAVAQTNAAQDIEPSIGVDDAGRAVVVWMRRGERGYAVMRREFDPAGRPIAPEMVIAAPTSNWQSGAAVAVAPDGRSIISWNEESRLSPPPTDGDPPPRESNVVAQRFEADGSSIGPPERVNQGADGRRTLPIGAVAARSVWTARDQIAHVWSGQTAHDTNGVGVSLSFPSDLTAPMPVAFVPRPAFTPDALRHLDTDDAAPVFDPGFVPEPPDINARGVGPDFGFLGDQSAGARPPDPEIAVGPDHVVLVVNSRLTIRTKADGAQTYARSITGLFGFWGEVGAGSFVFDPIAQYDTHTGRFVVAAGEHTGGEMFLNIAISDDSDPNGVWIKHRVNMTAFGTGMDYPILGIDDESISITCNFFGDPLAAWIFIFDKAQLMAGSVSLNPVQVSTSNPPTGAMTNYDTSPPAQYYASTWSNGADRLRLLAITDPNGSPSLFEHQLPVPQFAPPPDADQLGTTNLADTVDWRIKHGVVRNGSMWAAHNTRVTEHGPGGPFDIRNTTKVRWYEINLNGWPTSGSDPTLAQTGLINPGFGVHAWNSDISVDDAGNAAIVFNRSSPDEHIAVARAVRRVTDPPGVFRQSVRQQISTTPELQDRWGDYSGIQEDPVNPGIFWGHCEYRTSSWRTWVGRFSPLTPNPLGFELLSPADDSVKVGVTATLGWEDAEDAASYEVTIATDPGLVNTVALMTTTGSSWAVPPATLECGTLYYWGVVASGIGGDSVSTPGVFAFTTGLLADINGDGAVDTADLGILINQFGSVGPVADINGDGVVDTADLGVLIGSFGTTECQSN